MRDKDRNSGIALIGYIPWGTHLCQFYQTRDDLTEILVTYFKAGLENNEYCVWVTGVIGRRTMKTPDKYAKSILVVEDEPAICDICRRVLGSEGFKVEIAANGEIARDMVKKGQYDLYLIDIKMPVVGGKELYQGIKENKLQLADRVIFTSGDVMGGDTEIFLKQVHMPFLPKPFSPGELVAAVRQASQAWSEKTEKEK